jgi:hypothetical protein
MIWKKFDEKRKQSDHNYKILMILGNQRDFEVFFSGGEGVKNLLGGKETSEKQNFC